MLTKHLASTTNLKHKVRWSLTPQFGKTVIIKQNRAYKTIKVPIRQYPIIFLVFCGKLSLIFAKN